MKKEPTKSSKAKKHRPRGAASPLDYRPLFRAFREAFDWALDVAASLARDFPEEVEAVERVRAYMRARLAGRVASVEVDDVLFTFGLLIGAIDRDLGPVSSGPAVSPLHFPSADIWEPRIPRRFRATQWSLLDHLAVA